MLSRGILTGSAALALVAALLPFVRRAALRLNLFDQPGPLKIHSEPIARVGGVAMTLGLLAGVLFNAGQAQSAAAPFVASLLLIWVVGLWDDVRGLPPAFRLVAQLAAALLLVTTGFVGMIATAGVAFQFGACLFIVVFINAFNFLDGSDGVAAGVAAVIALGYVLLNGGSAASLGGQVAWALLGSSIGFLVSNFPPAKIFMGDCGSTTLGFVIAFLGLDYYSAGDSRSSRLLVPLLFAGLPLLDFGLAVLRRLNRRASLFAGDRQHLYDLLLQRGWSQRKVAISFYITTGLLLVSGLLCSSAGQRCWSELIADLLF